MGYDTLVKVEDSKAKGKRYAAIFRDSKSGRKKRVNFGNAKMENFTIHKDPERKKSYLNRYKSRENWNDPISPGALSRWILWGDSTSFDKSVSNYRKRFKLKTGRSMKSPGVKLKISTKKNKKGDRNPKRKMKAMSKAYSMPTGAYT